MVLIFIIFYIVLTRMRFGRNVYTVGGNPVGARLAGISTKGTTYALFVIMFELHLDVPLDTLDCIVPKLILQPLVENALLHGIFPTGDVGNVWIHAKKSSRFVTLSVQDDGVGMEHRHYYPQKRPSYSEG